MAEDARHDLWLIYEQLKEAEADEEKRLELLSRSREELGKVINVMHRQKEPGLYAFLSNAGAKGGSVSSEAKARAARENGSKGGRPKNTYFCRECAPWSDDPDNERLIDCSESTYAKQKTCSMCDERPVHYRLD